MKRTLQILGRGVDSIPEAASFTGASRRQVKYWFDSSRAHKRTFLETDYPLDGPTTIISFLDLIQVLVVQKLRVHGVSLQSIRRAYPELQKYLDMPHPFSYRRIFTDGRKIFIDAADRFDDEALIELVSRQRIIPEVMQPYLTRIDYAEDSEMACRWEIFEGIVLDPARRYGKPIVETCGMPASILASAYEANGGDESMVADWYNVMPNDVETAVAFIQEGATGLAA